MKILNWNVEWMNKWFSGNQTPQWGSRSLTASEAQNIAGKVARVIEAIGPDLICLQEGPSALEEMALFLNDFLGQSGGYEGLIAADGGAQKMYALRRVGGLVDGLAYGDDDATHALEDVWDADVNGDMLLEGYDFTRLPLVVDVDVQGQPNVRVIVLHTKSKYVHRGQQLFNDPNRRQEFIVQALEARRRISAEGFRLRSYLDTLLKDEPDARIIVTGDFNDGPGRDFFERSYLTHNVTDILLGSTFYPSLIFDHPLIQRVNPAALFTARFDDFVDDVRDRPLMLDHFIVSPSLKDRVLDAGIAHDVFESQIDNDGAQRHERPSDHRPIWMELGRPIS